MEKRTIIFTGGGSGGHVMPAITLIDSLKNNKNYQLKYIGSYNGIEKDLVALTGVEYLPISTGKLRRYIDWQNVTDIFRIIKGFFQALTFFLGHKRFNAVVVSMGGFVAVPVVFAAKLRGLRVIIHEQTSRVGLANRLCGFVANRILISFEKSRTFFPARKCNLVGYPLRDSIFRPVADSIMLENIDIKKLANERPLLLATGGGNGSLVINNIIKENFKWLNQHYLIVHQVGKNFLKEYQAYQNPWYFPVAFLGEEIIELMKISKVTISRAGAGTVSELIALRKISVFIPLKIAQKNEQYYNAMEAKEKIGSVVVSEDDVHQSDWSCIFTSVEKANSEEYKVRELGKNPREYIIAEIEQVASAT
jgi:UDP-N-acetylglucosamine--N-acetylmuramyl-(pentapeptide) pyrophosphoryl-undecaprenol N-acetylglucosamine transferase